MPKTYTDGSGITWTFDKGRWTKVADRPTTKSTVRDLPPASSPAPAADAGDYAAYASPLNEQSATLTSGTTMPFGLSDAMWNRGRPGQMGGGDPGYFTQGAAGIDPASGKPFSSLASSVKPGSGMNYGAGPQVQSTGGDGGGGLNSLNLGSSGGFGSGGMSMGGGGNMSSTPGYNQSVKAIGQPNYASLIQQLMQSMQGQNTAQQAAANKQYKQLLASVAGTRGQVEGLFGALGKTGEAQIQEQQQRQTGQTEQDLVSRGLGNTTIRSSMLNQVGRNAQFERQALQEGIAGSKIGTEMQLGQMQGDALLSRQNIPPNLGMYLNLIQSLGMGGGGQSGYTQIVK